MPRTADEVADSFRADLADAHTLLDNYEGPRAKTAKFLLGLAHRALTELSRILGDREGEGLFANRAGDPKD